MAPRDPSLPEGTDHIIDTNIDLGDTGGGSGGSGGAGTGGLGGGATGTGGGASGGGTGATGGTGAAGGAGATTGSSGTSGGGAGTGSTSGGSAFQFDKNGGSSSGSSGRSSGIAGQVRDQISTLKSQAGDRARSLADDGKSQATSFLQTVAQVVADAAGSVEERLGGQYAGMGHRASSSINSLASTLDERSVDDLIGDARSFVQRSPAVAIGVAAILGFAVARVVRSGISEYGGGQSDTGTTGGGAMGATGGTGATGGAGTSGGMARGGASGGLDASSGGFGEQGIGTAGTMGGSGVSTGAGSSGGTGNAPTI